MEEKGIEQSNFQNNTPEARGRKLLNFYLKIVFIFLLASGSFWIGFEKGKERERSFQKELSVPFKNAQILNQKDVVSGNGTVDFSLFWEAWDTLREKYVDAQELDANKLLYGAIKGMMWATGDPYTTFLDPEENQAFQEDISGSFEGIGAEIGLRDGVLTIISPLDESPAEKAGLLPGDKIVEIDGESAVELSIDEAVKKMRGAKGTEVMLTILREGDEKTREIIVTRDLINVKSVQFEMKDGGIAYIKITRFENGDTGREFNAVIAKMLSSGASGLVLDLRNNPGGYLDSAVDLASRMLPKGKVVVIEDDGQGKRREIFSQGGDRISHMETVILINEGSASASEILAGALKENRDNVTVVGEKSFGKGSVQELVNLPRKTAAKITVAKWLTPRGKQINNEGIEPDVKVELTLEDYENNRDPQLDKALEILKKN